MTVKLFKKPKFVPVKGFYPSDQKWNSNTLIYTTDETTEALKWLCKYQGSFESKKGCLRINRTKISERAYTITLEPQIGKDIFFMIFGDFSLIIGTPSKETIDIHPITFKIAHKSDYQTGIWLANAKDFQKNGIYLSTDRSNLGYFDTPIMNPEIIKNPEIKRWAHLIKNGLLKNAQSIIESTKNSTKPHVNMNVQPSPSTPLVPGFHYEFASSTFNDKVHEWFKTKVLKLCRKLNQENECHYSLHSGFITKDGKYNPPRFSHNFEYHNELMRKEASKTFENEFNTLVKRGFFGTWKDSFSCEKGQSQILSNRTINTTTMSAHEKFCILSQ